MQMVQCSKVRILFCIMMLFCIEISYRNRRTTTKAMREHYHATKEPKPPRHKKRTAEEMRQAEEDAALNSAVDKEAHMKKLDEEREREAGYVPTFYSTSSTNNHSSVSNGMFYAICAARAFSTPSCGHGPTSTARSI